ncbi:xanthine dehydrogenase family protein molybdopterin-binding subunit [Marinobacter fonticola]|uniref:xanthine dehydrogenase family protein molybdopterin-binding subunit n=1 Tax=Marinobacter fonticola TaxID=2603215 RepID=UPI0011E7005D|nr:xanthine dehydrogenase family protein molybdopterin-binding subunit [Marinobacter fonticola]
MSENAGTSPKSAGIIGAGPKRIDGRLKVTGSAPYASDHQPENMAYGHGVFSTIASGTVKNLDLSEAKASPGVIDIFHHGHFPELYHTPSSMEQNNKVEETRLPFEDNTIYYAGQFVALVVADTFENARAAAYKVKVEYEEHEAVANLEQGLKDNGTQSTGSENNHRRGDADAAFGQAAHRIDATYTTLVETHNPMELHATVAEWRGDQLKVYEASQAVVQQKGALAKIFGIAPNQVEVISTFIGSGFGSKLWMWPHAVTAAAAAQMLDRPVQVVVPRNQMFTTTGHRPETRQRIRLGTDNNGKLVAISHETISTTSFTDQYVEACGGMTKALYGCEDVTVTHETTQVNRGTPTSMRAPGATPGLFALESAIDEMAIAAGVDPLEFRMDNYADRDQSKDLPWSSNKIREATQQAAEAFGWSKRNPEIGAMRDGNEIIGWGMAACNWEALRRECDARVSLRADGTAYVTCATQDIGTGTYTVVAQAVSSVTGLPLEKITVKLGDSSYPNGPVSGGSWATATTLPAVAKATRLAIDQLKEHATSKKSPFEGAKGDDLSFANGKLHHSDGRSVDYTEVLESLRLASADGEGHTGGADTSEYSFRSFGAHFVEIRWDPGISNLRVSRVASAIDVGQIVNAKTSRNQIEGSVVMGIGSALFEGTNYDSRNGIPVNNNYAEYLVPTHADQPPEMEVILLDYPDYAFNEFGARGIGEIGITGISAAIANAVYHATGKRIREIPIRKEMLMDDVPAATA